MKIRLGELKRIIREALISDYELSSSSRGGFVGTPISEWSEDQVMGAWAKHAKNYYELMFYIKNGTAQEKIQASNEMKVCDRKLEFWQGHSRFNPSSAAVISNDLADEWEMDPLRVKQTHTAQRQPSTNKSPFSSPTAKAALGSVGAERVKNSKLGPGTIVKDLGGGIVMVVFDDPKRGGVAIKMSRDFLTPIA